MSERRGLCLRHRSKDFVSRPLNGRAVVSGAVGQLAPSASTAISGGGSMSISSINSSPVLQWLQNSLSTAGLTVGNQSSRGSGDSQSASSAISLFQQALQLMTNQTASPTDASQSLNVNGTQGMHHHHHHGHSGGGSNDLGHGSFIDQPAQSILSDLQQTDETGASSPTSSSSAIANNLLAKYQQATDSSQASSPLTQVNSIA